MGIGTHSLEGHQVLEDLGELHEVSGHTRSDRASVQGRILIQDGHFDSIRLGEAIHELPCTWATECLILVVRAEVHELAWVHAQECNDATVVLLRQSHITQPIIKARFHLQVDHTRLHGSAQWINNRTVGLQIASSTLEHIFVQFVHAHHVIQHGLVAGSLNALWC